MGVRTFEIRTRRWTTTTRLSKDSSAPQRDNRTPTKTPTTPVRINPHTPTSERHNRRVLQVKHIIHKVGITLKCGNALWWRTRANGHWSIPQRQRQEQRLQRKRQRKEQRKRRRQAWLQYRQRKRKVWRKATIRRTRTRISNWTRKRANEQPVQRRQRQRKRQGERKTSGQHVLQMWTTRALCEQLQSVRLQRSRQRHLQ